MARQSNTEFVTELMEFSSFGALSQMFIIQALSQYSAMVAEMDPAKADNAFIQGEAWVGVAKEIRDKIEDRLKG